MKGADRRHEVDFAGEFAGGDTFFTPAEIDDALDFLTASPSAARATRAGGRSLLASPLPLLLALAFLTAADLRILAPVLPSVAATFNLPPGRVGLAMTTYAVAFSFGQLVYGPLSDRFGRVRIVRAVAPAFALAAVLSAFAANNVQFAIARFVVGALGGAIIPLTLAYIGDNVEYDQRQSAIARVAVVTSAAFAASSAVGGTVAQLVDWRAMLAIVGLVALVPSVLLRFAPADVGSGRKLDLSGYVEILRAPRAGRVYLLTFFEGFFCWGAVTYLSALFQRRFGFGPLAAGELMSALGVGTIAGGLLMKYVRRVLAESTVGALGGFLFGIGYAVLAVSLPFGVAGAALFVMGIGFVGLVSTLQVRTTELHSARGSALALFAFCRFSGVAAGTAVLGRVVDLLGHSRMLAIAAVGPCLVGVILLIGLRKRA